MPLKFQLDTLDGVDEAHQSLYTKTDAGKFMLSVEGAVPADKLNEFRQTNINLLKERDALTAKYKDVDLDAYAAMTEQQRKLRDKELVDAGKIEELFGERTSTMKADHDKQLKAVARERDTMKGQLEGLLIDSALRDAAVKGGVAPTAIDDVLLRGRATFRLVDGKAVAMEGDKQLYGKNSEPLDVSEWVSGLAEKAPHLFPASTGGGAPKGGTPPTGGVGKTMPRSTFLALDPAAQSEALKDTKIVD